MLRSIAVCLLSLTVGSAASAQADAPEKRLEELATATSLTREGLKPWHLRLHFTVNGPDGKPVDTGTADLRWTAPGQETLQVESTVFHGAVPESDAAFASGTFRELYLLRQLIDETVRPVASFRGVQDLFFGEQVHKFSSAELRCLSVVRSRAVLKDLPPPAGAAFCTSASDPSLLRLHLESGLEIVRNRLAKFQQVNLALDSTISYAGQVLAAGQTEALEVATTNGEAQGEPSKGLSAPLVSSVVIAARKLHGDTPQYPQAARERHISGAVILAALIDENGNIKDLTLVASPDATLSQSALSVVKTWTFTPYTLQNQPIPITTAITVNYNLSVR